MADYTAAAARAIVRMDKAQDALNAARAERDAAIVKMHTEGHMTPPQISRALGADKVSTSLVRLTLRLAGVQ